MPQLAAFPKAYMDDLCLSGEMALGEWIEMAATLDVDGLEMYSGMLGLQSATGVEEAKKQAGDLGLSIPMLCCSPDFTHPEESFRREQIDKEKSWIDLCTALGGSYCRVLSGQRRPEVSRAEGIRFTVECIEACLDHAAANKVTLILENHYKDNYWEFPEFAQHMDVFCDLIVQIDSPHFGVNYDPSNTLIAGEDPIELLDKVKRRVVTMHASDRYLKSGTWDDLKREGEGIGYADRLQHGEIGKGLNDYDAIFSRLKSVGFDGWISIEDGVDGLDQLARSANFLRGKIRAHWGA